VSKANAIKNKDYLWILLFTTLLFIPIFLRGVNVPFFGGDPYYYLNFIFHGIPLHLHHVGVSHFFSLFPPNLLVIKFIMFVVAFFCGVVFYHTINLIKKGCAIYGVGLLFSLVWLNWIFVKFENDLFGFLFVLLGLYFLVRYRVQDSCSCVVLFNKNIILSLFFLGVGCFIWGFAVFYLYLFLFISGFHLYYVVGVFFSFLFFRTLLSKLLPSFQIAENQPLVGLFFIIVLCFLYLKRYRVSFLWGAIALGSIFLVLNLKFLYILLPVLLLQISMVDLSNNSYKKSIRNFVVGIIFVMFVLSFYLSFFTFPSYSDYSLFRVTQTSEVYDAESVYFTWSTGYFVGYHSGDVFHAGSPPVDQNNFISGFVFAFLRDPNVSDCFLLEGSTNVGLFNCD
jgi:hypothetical protein